MTIQELAHDQGNIRHTIDSVGRLQGHWYFYTLSVKEPAFQHSGA